MLNKKPIFIIAFARGGSNILLNLLRSHPQVCSPRGETHEVFKGKGSWEPYQVRLVKALNYLPIRLMQKEDIFSIKHWGKRKIVSKTIQSLIDRLLFYEKMKALDRSQNYYKTEGVRYNRREIKESRLLCKNLDGLIFLTDMFYEMYPDATFIALVRNGFAVCEGHKRRGDDIAEIARNYESGCSKMIQDQKRIPNYHIMRYEDIIEKPLESLNEIYSCAGLDVSLVRKIRLETKPVIRSDGHHGFIHGTNRKELVWYDADEFHRHFINDANSNQIERLSEEEKQTIVKFARESLSHFSYI